MVLVALLTPVKIQLELLARLTAIAVLVLARQQLYFASNHMALYAQLQTSVLLVFAAALFLVYVY